MRTSLIQMQQTTITTTAEVDGMTLLETEQIKTSLEFADEFGLAEHEKKQAKKRLGRSLHRQ